MKGGIGNLMRQAQQMQEKLQKAQVALEVTGESGGGMVKVVMNGKHEVKRVTLDPSVAGDDRELLEDLLAAAFNDGVRKVEAAQQASLQGLMGGMQLPPGFKSPF